MNFELFSLPRIVFGAGSIQRLQESAQSLGEHALLVHSKSATSVSENLKPMRFTAVVQDGEPTVGDIEAKLKVARDAKCDCVIAIGGGSAIDAGKAVAALISNGGSPSDYMEVVGLGKKISKLAA